VLALRRELAHGVVEIVGEPHHVVGVDGDAVGATDHALAPRAEEVAVAIEDDDRVLAPREDKRAVLLSTATPPPRGTSPSGSFPQPSITENFICTLDRLGIRSKRRLSGVRPSSWVMT